MYFVGSVSSGDLTRRLATFSPFSTSRVFERRGISTVGLGLGRQTEPQVAMSSVDLDQVLYARAGWRKTILIPLWIFQVAVLLCLMGIFAYRLAETFEHYEEMNKLGEVPIVEVV